jgi:hypothetical protein
MIPMTNGLTNFTSNGKLISHSETRARTQDV